MMEQAKNPLANDVAAFSPLDRLQPAWELLGAGGPVVGILIAMSVVALAIILLKLVQFRTVRLGERRFVGDAVRLYRSGDIAEALARLGGARNPIARVMEVAIHGLRRRNVSEQILREEITRVAGEHIDRLRSHLRALEVIASLSPLLGLFGTVLGMIEVFQAMERAGSQVSPAVLSGGIWEALLTTAVGLAVAIPVVAVVNWLDAAVDRLAADMESAVTRLFTFELSYREDDGDVAPFGLAQPAE